MGYRLSRKADEDVLDMYLQGVRDFGTEQAEGYFVGLEEAFDFLAAFPRAARERMEIAPAVRIHRYRSHVVVYLIEDGDVLILRVRHGREDWVRDPEG